MNNKELLQFIEDKEIEINPKWYYHATYKDINIILEILNKGIKSSILRDEKSAGYNGKYYISLGKVTDKENIIYSNFKGYLKFILTDIYPIKTSQNYFSSLRDTILPLRYSDYKGEYHSFLKINSLKIIALEYSLADLLLEDNELDNKKLNFLKNLVLSLDKSNIDMPIYDFSSNKEINKEKIKKI